MVGFIVNNGQTSTGLTVSSGEQAIVQAGGAATSITILGGGIESVLGHANDTILAGGKQIVGAGGLVSGSVVQSGGYELVSSGGTDSFAVVSGGGTQFVAGSANFTTISAGGSQRVAAGGRVLGVTVLNGGTQTVLGGGMASFTLLSAFGSYQFISSGGVASGTILTGASQDTVLSGGLSISTTMAQAGIDSEIVASGGTAHGTNLGAGNFQYVLFGGTAISSIIGSTSTEFATGLASAAQIGSGGTLQVRAGGSASFAQVSSGGSLFISSGGSAAGTTVLRGGLEVITSGAQVSFSLLSAGAAMDITDLPYVSGGTAALLANLLIVQQGGSVYTQTLSGNYTDEYFHALSDGTGGTLVTVDGTPCYCRGTRILTDHGEIAVENLRIGDRLITHAGIPRPLIWIGRRRYSREAAAGNPELLPIRIRAGALADGLPRRDLLVSPPHAMFIESCLIPAAALINRTSIVQTEAVDRVEYFHLELETHDIIIAEGALSESFVDDESRGMFDNADQYNQLYPDTRRIPAQYCAPRLDGGDWLELIRRRLAERGQNAIPAGPTETAREQTPQGRLDLVERGRICGWARHAAAPDQPVRLCIIDNDVTIGEVVADRYRPDLAAAGYGNGCHAFELIVPGGLSPAARHVIEVRCAERGHKLPNSPQILEPSPIEPLTINTDDRTGHDPWRGSVDVVTRERIAGWAQNPAQPDTPIALQLLDNGTLIARILANQYRPDLAAAGIGTGWHSFDFVIPGGLSALSRHVIEVRRENDGRRLGEPTLIETAASFDASLEQALAHAVDAVDSDEQERVLSFMLAQTERLRQHRADHDGQREARRTGRQARRRAPRTAAAEPAPRALVVDSRLPDPRRDGGSTAILSHMRALQRLGYQVSFVAAGATTQPESSAAASSMPPGITLCQQPFYASVEEVLRRQAGCFDLIYLHRVDIAARYLALARSYSPQARIIYSVADLHHLRLARQAAIEDRPDILAESRRLRLAECTAAWSADAVISHSPTEVEILQQAVPQARVHHVPWDVVPETSNVAFINRSGIALIGNYAHAPNVDAARFLVESVMPLVWQVDANITCRLVGGEATQMIRLLTGPGVQVVGSVQDLHRDVFDQVRLSVAPLRYGAGLKGKVLESFAAGVPCVMSEIAAEGFPLSPTLRDCVGTDAAGMAATICRLHTQPASHQIAATAGLSLIREHFSADRVTTALQAAIEKRGARCPNIKASAPGRGVRPSAERPPELGQSPGC